MLRDMHVDTSLISIVYIYDFFKSCSILSLKHVDLINRYLSGLADLRNQRPFRFRIKATMSWY
jgi:hypothetical protein